jgi:hypothetical protein
MRAKSAALARVLPHMHKSAEGRPNAKKYIHRSSKYRIRRDSDKPRAIQINLRTQGQINGKEEDVARPTYSKQ